MKDIYLISCTKSKQSYTCRAEKMYLPSARFRASLAYAENRVKNRHDQIFIISAKHGLLALGDTIDPYNETLIGKPVDECDAWGHQVAATLSDRFDLADTNFIILAGYSYIRPLVGKLQHITTPLAGKTMGVGTSWLNEHRVPRQDEIDISIAPKYPNQVEAKPAKPSPKSNKTPENIPNWEDLLEILRAGTEIQTINQKGEPNLWFQVTSIGNEIHIKPTKNHTPSSKASPFVLSKSHYDIIKPYYESWREGRTSREYIRTLSHFSTYIFALMNHFRASAQDAPSQEAKSVRQIQINNQEKPPTSKQDFVSQHRLLVPAVKLRHKEFLHAVPDDQPGWYRWWAPEVALKLMLDSPHLTEGFYDSVFPHLTKGEAKLQGHYCLYVGVAINESMRARLDWHINQVHTRSNVYHGSLSTLRQTISSLLTANQASEAETNAFIDMLQIEFQAFPLPIKSREARAMIEAIENKEIRNTVYLLNIKDNNHDFIRPFRNQLSKLRQAAKDTALQRGFTDSSPLEVIGSIRGVASEDFVHERLERQKWIKDNYSDYLGDEPLNVSIQLRKTPTADFDLCCALLTLLLREDHFCEGSFGMRVQEGSVDKILDRMTELLSKGESK